MNNDAGTSVSGSPNGGPAGDTTACTSDADCAASVPPTKQVPGVGPNCAAGKCNVLEGMCHYVAKDEDGDRHPAANRVSTNGVAIEEGDDCNDQDPNLYPSLSETCTTTASGDTPAGTRCTSGKVTCMADGTALLCADTVR